MICPNCDSQLTTATQKVEFEDSDDNTKTIKVTATWCINCSYEQGVY